MVLPNTVARIKGGLNPAGARTLIEFILSENVARLLAASDSKNASVYEKVQAEFPATAITRPWEVGATTIADALPVASAMAREILGPG